jgi:hypothetical protein
LEAVLDRGRVFEKLEADLEALRKRERSSSEAAAQFESSRIEAGPSREQAMNFIDLMTLDEGWWASKASTFSIDDFFFCSWSRRRTQDGRSW